MPWEPQRAVDEQAMLLWRCPCAPELEFARVPPNLAKIRTDISGNCEKAPYHMPQKLIVVFGSTQNTKVESHVAFITVLAGGVDFVLCLLLCASLLILPLSLTSPSKAGLRNTAPPLFPFLVQLHTVSKMTAYGELGDDVMGKQGRRASLAGVLAGGVPFSLTSPSKAGSRNPPPPLSPLLVQLCTVSK